MQENLQELIRLVQENPELPVICADDRVFIADDSEEFKERYYYNHDEELCEKFGYDPRINEWTTNKGQYTLEAFAKNSEREEAIERYLDKIADRYFKRAIIVNIVLPDYEPEPEEKE